MSKRCARCEKTVYPIEELKCLDKVWHKSCFKCQECNMTLSMKTYKGYNKLPYCEAHIPKAKATTVAETPEMKRLAENTKNQSNVQYHAEFEKTKSKFTPVVDDPETLRLKANTKNISNVAYHEEWKRKGMDKMRPADMERGGSVELDDQQYYEEQLGQLQSLQISKPAEHAPPPQAVGGGGYAERGYGYQGNAPPVQRGSHPPSNSMNNNSTHAPHQQMQTPAHRQPSHPQRDYNQNPGQRAPHPDAGYAGERVRSHPDPSAAWQQQQQRHSGGAVPSHYEGGYGGGREMPSQSTAQYQRPPLDHEAYRHEGHQPSTYGGHYPPPQQVYDYQAAPHQPKYAMQQQHVQPAPQQQQQQQQYMQYGQSGGSPRKSTGPPTNIGRCYQALYDYEAADTDEISFRDGDLIINCSDVDEGWMTGTVQRTSASGMLPANYVRRVS
ncbi:Zinc finger LIM-type [Trinorchestia longiramus]|nr:Zinc finger LIM-type [Trinorchestia longiramus]